jgi:predicted PurR-regulated permease PerM
VTVGQALAPWGFVLFVVAVPVVFHSVALPFVVGMLLAFALAPVVGRLSRRRMPRWAAVLVVYVAIGGALALFLTAFLPHLSGEFARLLHETPRFFQRMKSEYVPRADAWLEQNFPRSPPSPAVEETSEPHRERKLLVRPLPGGELEVSLEGLELELQAAGEHRWVIGPRSDGDERRTRLGELLQSAASATQSQLKQVLLVGRRFVAGVLKGFAWFILSFMVAAYLLADPGRVLSFLRRLVPAPHRTSFDQLLIEMDRGLAGVVRGQLLICLVNAILTTTGLLLFDVKYALLLGLVAGMMSFIPVFGSILSSVPIVAVALTSGPSGVDLPKGLAVLGWILGIHLLEANVLNPRIIGTAARMHPVIVVFALLVGEQTGGLIGALLAVPAASMVQAVFLFYLDRRVEAAA